MKLLKMKKTVAATAATIACFAAHADIYNFSYIFDTGSNVTGSFSGTAAGDLVTVQSFISGALNGNSFIQGGESFVSSLGNCIQNGPCGPARVSLNGTNHNFHFGTEDNGFGSFGFSIAPVEGAGFSAFARRADNLAGGVEFGGDNNGYSAARWSVTNVSAVPEPETYAMMLAGLGVMGVIARRRKAKQTA